MDYPVHDRLVDGPVGLQRGLTAHARVYTCVCVCRGQKRLICIMHDVLRDKLIHILFPLKKKGLASRINATEKLIIDRG